MGLTQQEMADYLSISVQAYRKKEKNFTPFKDAEKLLIRDKVKKYGFLDITIDDIFLHLSSKLVSWKGALNNESSKITCRTNKRKYNYRTKASCSKSVIC